MARLFVPAALLLLLLACASLPKVSTAGPTGRRLLQPKLGPDCSLSAGPCDLETVDPVRCCGCGGADTCDAVDPSSSAAATVEPCSGSDSNAADSDGTGSDAPTKDCTWAYIDALPRSVKDAMKACNKGEAPESFTSAIIKKLPQDDAKALWPELLCQPAEVAVAYIKQQNPKLDVVVYKVGTASIGDIEDDRVNVWLNEDGIVRVTPDRG